MKYEPVDPTEARGMVRAIREARSLKDDEEVFIFVCKQNDIWTDADEGIEAYKRFKESGERTLLSIVRVFFSRMKGSFE